MGTTNDIRKHANFINKSRAFEKHGQPRPEAEEERRRREEEGWVAIMEREMGEERQL